MSLVDDIQMLQEQADGCTFEFTFIGNDCRNLATITFSNPNWEFAVLRHMRIHTTLANFVELLESARIIHPGHPYDDDDDEFDFDEEEDDE
jgi:hypothetical protein